MPKEFLSLKSAYLATKPVRQDSLNLRLHRSLSWLEVGETTGDLDFKFISFWVSFNAIYAKELSVQGGDRTSFREFLTRITSFDKDKKLHAILMEKFSGNIRNLLNNKYIFQPFWDYHNGNGAKNWADEFDELNKKAFTHLLNQNVDGVLFVVFDRLYTLRNQIIHGGATHDSSVNREQVRMGCEILAAVLPIVIEIVMNHHDRDWGKPFYPLVD